MASGGLEVDRTTLSAPTARIVMGQDVIGALQDVNWTENNNLVRVKGMGARTDVVQVDGFTEYEITARRAFIDGDMFFTLLSPIDTTLLANAYGLGAPVDLAGTSVYTADPTLVNTKAALLATVLTETTQAVSLVFKIDIQNTFGQVVFSFDKCKINIRRVSMTTGSIIMSEDLTILSRYKSFPASQLAQEIANIGPSSLPVSQP